MTVMLGVASGRGLCFKMIIVFKFNTWAFAEQSNMKDIFYKMCFYRIYQPLWCARGGGGVGLNEAGDLYVE